MEIEFLDDPTYAIREREMQKIHDVLTKNVAYEPKSIFLKKMVYALIEATKVVPKTNYDTIKLPNLHIGNKPLHQTLNPSHIDFDSNLQIPTKKQPLTPNIPKSSILYAKLQEKTENKIETNINQNFNLEPSIQKIQLPIKKDLSVEEIKYSKPEIKESPIEIKQPVVKKVSLEDGIPIPSPPKSFRKTQMYDTQISTPPPISQQIKIENKVSAPSKTVENPVLISKVESSAKPQVTYPNSMQIKEIDHRLVDINTLRPPQPPKLVGVSPSRPEIKLPPPPKVIAKVEQPKAISKPVENHDITIESLPEVDVDENVLRIKSIPEEEKKYMPPETPHVTPSNLEIQPTKTTIQRDPNKNYFEIEHHNTEGEYTELEPIEKKIIPLHEEIELTATPIQRKAQSILPPPPKPTGGQISSGQDSRNSGTFLDINPRSGVREMEGNILYEVADPFASPLQEVFEYIRLSALVSPNKTSDNKFLDESFKKMSKQLNINLQEKDKFSIMAKVNEHINGFGKIKDLLGDPSISGIYCTGLNRPLSVDFRLIGKIPTNVIFVDKLELERLIKNMARMAGKSITESNPILDVTLPGNIKVEATLGGDFISSKFVIKKV